MPANKQREKSTVNTSDNNEPTIKRAHIDVSLIIAMLSFILAALSFLFSVLPQLNPFNSNLIERANAGDIKSQIMLADHYYEIADVSESVYWYKIASTQESQYQAALLNNLACIYINSDPLLDWDRTTIIKAYKAFLKAGELGEITAYQNAYILIHEIPEELLLDNGIKPTDEAWLHLELLKNDAFTQKLKNIATMEFVGYFDSLSEVPDYSDEVHVFFPVWDTREVIKENPDGTTCSVTESYIRRAVYKKLDEIELPDYIYIHDILDSY